ncbi:hypothetical protein [Salibacterium sp. K-3]
MAFGITRRELDEWKQNVLNGDIAFITHFWYDRRFPEHQSVTKAGCANIYKLEEWGRKHGLKPEWIHDRASYPHFDLLGSVQITVLKKEGQLSQLKRFTETSSDYV